MITAAGGETGIASVQCDQLMRLDSTCEQLVEAIKNNSYTELLLEDFKAGNISSSDKESKYISRANGDLSQVWIQEWAATAKQHLNTYPRRGLLPSFEGILGEDVRLCALRVPLACALGVFLSRVPLACVSCVGLSRN